MRISSCESGLRVHFSRRAKPLHPPLLAPHKPPFPAPMLPGPLRYVSRPLSGLRRPLPSRPATHSSTLPAARGLPLCCPRRRPPLPCSPWRSPAPAAGNYGPGRRLLRRHSLLPNNATQRRLLAPICPRASSCAAGCDTSPAGSDHFPRYSPLRAAALRAADRWSVS